MIVRTIKTRLDELKMTRYQLARAIGIAPTHIYRMLATESIPTRHLDRMLVVLDLELTPRSANKKRRAG